MDDLEDTMFEYEELADQVIEEIRELIDIDEQVIHKNHDFAEQLMGIELVVGHIDERVEEHMPHLHDLIGACTDVFEKIGVLIKEKSHRDTLIEREEEDVLQQLQTSMKQKEWNGVKQKEWRLVRERAKAKLGIRGFIAELKEKIRELIGREKGTLKRELDLLVEFHSHFKKLKHLMERSELHKAILADSAPEATENKIAHYFMEIYKFVRMYERVFRDFWKKKKHVYDKLEAQS